MANYSLKSRIIFDLYFNADLQSPIHIGSGEELDLKKVVLINGEPIIPSESIKGVLRSLALRIAKSMKFNGTVEDAIKNHEKDFHIPIEKEEKEKILNKFKENAKEFLIKELKFLNKQIEGEISDEDMVNIYLAWHCPICKLFGAPNLAGKLNIYDAHPEGLWSIDTYTSTLISRKTKTVEKERLFTIQAVYPFRELSYRVRIIADNLDFKEEDGRLLLNTLKFICNYGLRIGGLKSRGYGYLKLDCEKSKVKIIEFNTNPKTNDDIKENIEKLLLKKYKEVILKELLGGR